MNGMTSNDIYENRNWQRIEDSTTNYQSMDFEEQSESQKSRKPKLREVNVIMIISFLIIGLLAIFVLVACLISALHRIKEGHVGIYFKHEALMNEISDPGIHWAQPFVTRVEMILVRPETKFLDPLICTTRDGVRNVFRDVQVISSVDKNKVLDLVKDFGLNLKKMLVYERISESMQIFCSNHSIDEVYNTKFLDIIEFVKVNLNNYLAKFAPKDSIKIWNVFLPKPDVPPAIASNYKEVKVEWTKQLVAEQRQKTEKIEKETEKMKAVLDAEIEKQVEQIEVSKRILEEEGNKNVSSIKNKILYERLRNEADAMNYVQEQEASTNEILLTDQYIKLQIAKSLANNTKLYFSGPESVMGNVLENLLQPNNNKK